LFDLGGTLFAHQPTDSSLANLAHAARQLGIDRSPDALLSEFRAARQAVEAEFADRPFYLHRELVASGIARFAENLGYRPRDAWVAEYCDRQRASVVAELQLRDDCIATLAALRRRGHYLAIVSNIDDDYLLPLLDRTGLDALFDHYTSSEAAGACKPDSAFFEHALRLAGLNADDVLFVGDSLLHDVAGARRVGMDVAWLREGEASAHSAADAAPTFAIQRLGDLLDLLR
jgi:2-haloalkanoic acid dehalogenase type II